MALIRRFPIKYKFLAVLIALQISALSLFSVTAFRTFVQDKKQFVMELNLATLDAATSRIALELSRRLTELGIFLPYVYERTSALKTVDDFPAGVDRLPEEVIAVHFFSSDPATHFAAIGQYRNAPLIESREIEEKYIDDLKNLDAASFADSSVGNILFKNRSVQLSAKKSLPIVTIVMRVPVKSAKQKEIIVAVDLLQEFLIQALQRSDIANVFLISTDGELISHSSTEETVSHAGRRYPHPILTASARKARIKESLELTVGSEKVLCSIADTHFGNLSIVSQVSEVHAFFALKQLLRYCFLLGLGVLYGSFVVSLFFSRRLTANIAKLEVAAKEVGKGNLDVTVGIRSNDEIQSVGETLQLMSGQVKTLLTQSAEKARMENELKMASTLQELLLSQKSIKVPGVEVETFYRPASECGGDYWDMKLRGNKLTVLIADATGHGAPAAIVTSLAKSCFCTMNSLPESVALTPADYLTQINQTLFDAAHGQLGMTMSVFQIDLAENQFMLSSAGHEMPLLVSGKSADPTGKGEKPQALFVRGERLGFSVESEYENQTFAISPGDSLLLYTDGLIETQGTNGKPWSERHLSKTLARGKQLPLVESRDQIANAFLNHLGTSPLVDDITFVLIRREVVLPKRKAA
jgi:sigma-B regulation protein RsbU (phosphoserine phosphatase)